MAIIFFLNYGSSAQMANTWYFGQSAGLRFLPDGSVVALSDGQLVTNEGCSAISDNGGNLLFYTDGRTVWDRNHLAMPGGSLAFGTELHGDTSSSQSAIIVPKPGDPNIYYVFTVDEPHHLNAATYPNPFSGSYGSEEGSTPEADDGLNNGLNYSVVDLTVTGSNGSVGNVVSRNNHLVTYGSSVDEVKYKCAEKITAVKNEADGSFWVITHFINKFYVFKVDSGGVQAVPMVFEIGTNVSVSGYRRNAIGYLKASPDGTKLAIAHSERGNVSGGIAFETGAVELFDFNTMNGTISNAQTLLTGVSAYGVEFSPNSQRLYATYRIGTTSQFELSQFDLLSSDISASKTAIFQGNKLYALQLAPNKKIYCAIELASALSVINNPDENGTTCNYVHLGQPLAPATFSRLGLPPFVSSFFNVSFSAQNFCAGSSTQFTLSNANVTSATWDFGDGSLPSNEINPAHVYISAGNYTVSVVVSGTSGTASYSRTISISSVPIVASTIPSENLCGQSGISYDLSQHNVELLGAQNPTIFAVAYFQSSADAQLHFNMLPLDLQLSPGLTTITAKVFNIQNPTCYALTSFEIALHQQPMTSPPQNLVQCDDEMNDGFQSFDLTEVNASIIGGQNSELFTVTYHASYEDAASNVVPLANIFTNTSNPQTIYVRISNTQNPSCFTTSSVNLYVVGSPVVVNLPDLSACDAGNDQIEMFDLNQQNELIVNAQPATVNISYHLSYEDALTGQNNLALDYSAQQSTTTVFYRVSNAAFPSCHHIASFELHIYPEPELVIAPQTMCLGGTVTVQAPPGYHSYLWSNGQTSQEAVFYQSGTQSLTVTLQHGTIECSATTFFEIVESEPPTIQELLIRDWTDNNNAVTIITSGGGQYEFSIDGLNFQDENTFNQLLPGYYTVYVHDKLNCGTVTKDFAIMMYPRFFTPNGDGSNDIWQIKQAAWEPNMSIFIFDRYGKLLKQLSGIDRGWDGTVGSKPVVATDYWFLVTRQNGSMYSGHFSLKR